MSSKQSDLSKKTCAQVLDVGAALGAEPEEDVRWLGAALLEGLARWMPRTPVVLNVYDLGTEGGTGGMGRLTNALPGLNTVLRGVVGGAFHGALSVYGLEYSFGWNDQDLTGVFECENCGNTAHRFRESIPLGDTRLGRKELEWILSRELMEAWPGDSYDLLRRNCCHFCEEFAGILGVKPLPSWMNSLANTGAALANTAEKLRGAAEGGGGAGGGGGGASGAPGAPV